MTDSATELLAAARAALLPMAEANERLSSIGMLSPREKRCAEQLRVAADRLTAAVHAVEDMAFAGK